MLVRRMCVTLVAVLASFGGLTPPVHAATVSGSATFRPTDGLVQSWVVPDGVRSIEVELLGAAGGTGGLDCGSGCSRIPGSKAGRVVATLAVTTGQSVAIYPGRAGINGRDNSGCYDLGGAGGASGYGLEGGHGGDSGCVGASGGGGGGGAGSAIVFAGTEVVAGGAGGGAGNRNHGEEWWQSGRTEGPRLDSRSGSGGVSPREARGSGVDGGGGGGGGGGWSGGAGGSEVTCCGEFGASGGVRGSNGWTAGVQAQESVVDRSGDGVVIVTWSQRFATLPSAPRDVTIATTSPTTAGLNWAPPSDDGDSPLLRYVVSAKPESDSAWRDVAIVPGDSTTATVDLPCGSRVSLRVRAENAVGVGASSGPVEWVSRSSQFAVCPVYPQVTLPGTAVRVAVVGAVAGPGEVSSGTVLFTYRGQATAVSVDDDGNAAITVTPTARGKSAVNVATRVLDTVSHKVRTRRETVYVWTPSFTVPTSALVGQQLRVVGSYIAPGVQVTLSTVDGDQQQIADARGTVRFAVPLTTRGVQQVFVKHNDRVIASASVKVGGKPSTW
ncbi:MAG: fibronectin type III domain-containing protein [Actinomycetales bacterium]|nr:fibronectin type III domain-containing protein [Actinomycetales bacterium]